MPPLFPGSSELRAHRLCVFLLLALLLPAGVHGYAQAQAAVAQVASLRGVVQDGTGAVLPGARVELQRLDSSLIAATQTDAAGRFSLPQPAAGDYRITVAIEGFEPMARPVHVAKTPLTSMMFTLKPAGMATSVDVNASDAGEVAAPEQNQDSASISAADMKNLPIFDGDIVATLSAFLDLNVVGEGGPQLIVDGVSSKTVGVAPSAIERVSINQDPYAAMYWTPGRGQVELITKGTTDKFHGSASFTFRDSALNASNYFAATKPPEQRRIYEGYLSGPIRFLPRAALLFSVTREEEDVYAFVDATSVPVPTPAQNVPAPSRSTALTMKVSHQWSERHSGFLLYRFYDAIKVAANVGGQTLASAGFTQDAFDQDLTYHDDFVLGTSMINQFSLLFEHNVDDSRNMQEAQKIAIQGVATFGSGQYDILNTENNPNLSDIFAWSFGGSKHTTHQLKFGIQLPNMGRRIIEDRSNWQGSWTFSSLAAYQAGTPASFNIQQGQPKWLTYYLQPGAFVQDQVQATKRLTVTAGVRYDWLNVFPTTLNAFLPRLSLAYLLDTAHAMVLRVGGGTYTRRVGPDVEERITRYENAGERNLVLYNNLCYPDITVCTNLAAQPPGLYRPQENLKTPAQGYFGLTVERQFTKNSTITFGYNGFRGWHAVRTVDVNAPLQPLVSKARPNPAFGQVLELNSGAVQKTDGLIASFRGRIANVFSGFAQYGYQHADSDTEYSLFQPQDQYHPNADWGRSNNDQRQRLSLFGTFYPEKVFNLGIGFYSYTPYPYTATTGLDTYDPGIYTARPAGVPRNSLNGTTYQDVQLRWGYNFKTRPRLKTASPTVGLSVSSFNTLNRVNFSGFDGVVSSPYFRQPTTANDPRRIQLRASYTF